MPSKNQQLKTIEKKPMNYFLTQTPKNDLIASATEAAIELDWLKNRIGITAEERRRVAEIVERVHANCNLIRALQVHH